MPNNLSFNVGYFEGQQHTKIWLVSRADFATMYSRYPKGEITLWCEGNSTEEEDCRSKKRRKKDSDFSSRRQEKENDSAFKVLKEKHGDKYSTPKLRLWARMYSSDLHDDLDKPPNIPAFQSDVTPKRPRRESLSDVLSGTAVAIAQALKKPSEVNASVQLPPSGISPTKAVELRMKNYEQLRYLQQLFADGILSSTEFEEQKHSVLTSLRKLTDKI